MAVKGMHRGDDGPGRYASSCYFLSAAPRSLALKIVESEWEMRKDEKSLCVCGRVFVCGWPNNMQRQTVGATGDGHRFSINFSLARLAAPLGKFLMSK